MEKEMGKGKNILMVKYYLKEYFQMIKDGMEKDMIQIIKLYFF